MAEEKNEKAMIDHEEGKKKKITFPILRVILIKGSFLLQWFMAAFKSKVILLLLPWQNRSFNGNLI